MVLRKFTLLILLTLLTACGLENVRVSIGEPTTVNSSEPQVVTVVVVVTPTQEPLSKIVLSPTPSKQDILAELTPSDDGTEQAGPGGLPTSEAPPNLPPGRWQPVSDLPRYINALVADPYNPQVVYAGTGSAGSGSGVYKSEDGGLTWQLAADGLPSEDVTALALSPTQPPRLYAILGVRGEVYTSADGAQIWTQLSNSGFFGGYERGLYIDPHNSNVIFALAKANELARSSDGGGTWLPFDVDLPRDEHSVHVLSLAIDPTDSQIIYAGTGGHVGGGHGVYKSTDGGQAWLAANQGMLDYRITALAVDPANHQTVYAGADDGVFFKTTDGGQTWANLSDRLPFPRNSSPAIREIIIDSPDMVFLLAGRAGVFVSQDGGLTWQALGNPDESAGEFSAMVLVSGSEPILIIGASRAGSWRYSEE